jgi:RNA polymerase sigma-70 factor (ECF subfamily)
LIRVPQIDLNTTLQLVRGAQAGDRAALDDLFTRYLPRVRRIVALRLGCPMKDFAQYEDLVQESMLRTFEKLDQFKEQSEGTFYHWVASCVASAVNLEFRKLGAQKRGGGKVKPFGAFASEDLSASFFPSDTPGPRTRASAHELEARLEAALLGLKSHHREIIVLRHICGMSSEEVAASLGFSNAATARKALERALDALKERLGPDAAGLV